MVRSAWLLFVILFCLGSLLTPAMVQPADPAGSVPLPQSPAQEEPVARQLLAAALARLTPEQTPWLETRIWQRTCCEPLCYEAQGYFLAGPGQRRRLSLEVHTGHCCSHLLLVSDGQRLLIWRGRAGGRQLLGQVPLSTREEQIHVGEDLLQQQGVGGPAGLLRCIGQRWQKLRCDRICWGNREIYCLTGDWPTPACAADELELQVRRCRVYLEARTLWPCRIEWWGGTVGQADQLLSEMEFFSPVLHAQPPASWQSAFTLPSS